MGNGYSAFRLRLLDSRSVMLSNSVPIHIYLSIYTQIFAAANGCSGRAIIYSVRPFCFSAVKGFMRKKITDNVQLGHLTFLRIFVSFNYMQSTHFDV